MVTQEEESRRKAQEVDNEVNQKWTAVSPFGSCSPSLAHDTDDAISESSWTSLAKEKERDWWSVDLEGEMEKLEVEVF